MDAFESIRAYLVSQFIDLKPSFVSKKPHFNFISAHYLWIIGMAILGSVILFASGRGDLAYIDALFFASGANTQAGLNTVNVNDLNTFQQVMLFIMAMTSNPITINSFVVFLRLYWFEKRFQNIVREARQRRGTLSKSKAKAENNMVDTERGVNGRNITVIHNGEKTRITNDGILLNGTGSKLPSQDRSRSSDEQGSRHRPEDEDAEEMDPISSPAEGRRPEITFANTVKRSDGLSDGVAKLPPTRSDEEHIAILERQRKGSDEVLRIPGPRDAERGMRPKRVEDGEVEEPEPFSLRRDHEMEVPKPPPTQPQGPRPQTITIAEPEGPQRERREQREKESMGDEFIDNARAFARVLTFLRIRKPRFFNRRDQKLHQEENELHARPSMRGRRHTLESLRAAFSRDKEEMAPYLSWEPTLGRNSAFPDLTEEQREELGGIEYRSLKTLALVLTCYFWGFWCLGIICLLPWIIRDNFYGSIVDDVSQSRIWWGFFTPNSAFMDLGFTLTPDSMNSFNTAVLPMILMAFLIVIGNTGFPVMLRFTIWISSNLVPRGTGLWEELRFLLDHPRRCFTLLFPSAATWWLFWLLVVLNGVDVIFFIILDLGTGVIADLPGGIKVLDGLFQATSTRTAGFSCVNLADLHPGVQVSYLIMMYISVFPIAISVRRTNVYEEKSLGIYTKHDEDEGSNPGGLSYVGAHLRRQLSFDLWYIFVGLFILSISEGPRLMTGDFSMFAVLFEIVSAYGTVGMSLGYPTTDASLSSQFSVVGKLVIIAMMIRGRHRGLPYGLDRAILLPSESLISKETADADARMTRQNSQISVAASSRAPPGRRSRSRSVDRRNSNLLTSFLHPGPALPHDHNPFAPQRRSTERPADLTSRSNLEDDSPYTSRVLPRRAETTSLTKRYSAEGSNKLRAG